MTALTLTALVTALVALGCGVALGRWSSRCAHGTRDSDLGTPTEAATFFTLHTASLAAPPLRGGLTVESARKASRRLRALLGTEALCLTDREQVLAWDGPGLAHHGELIMEQVASVLATGRGKAFPTRCRVADCTLQWAVATPLAVDDTQQGVLIAFAERESAVLVRAAGEVARWVSVQLELAELDRSRTRLIEAEIRALRAQISPHFIYNSLAVIASFVRTDPDRARELLLEFADFTRYSFRRHGDFTTLAEELHSVEQYVNLARARFGDRLQVSLEIAPEVLPVSLPFLCLQPLVENAIKHGMADRTEPCLITVTARDSGPDAVVEIEDDGVGMDPERLRRILDGERRVDSGIGLFNVDERLRQVYGEDHGLVVETAMGAGMKITVRVPKYHRGVQASCAATPAVG
ncbi:sensor histidine kinase [Streptacidiphilus fuscans]|uniref:Histidine kinase n=1 Tax=Streptacidiphilus fuscans TaxID=2789292 RepID=A0A931BFM5_9ACTN|nr:histidine kinase [Streptacidiphilus fuscans]MBF9072585.1 histidine kinase [Streptacidiphilus fuscans]